MLSFRFVFLGGLLCLAAPSRAQEAASPTPPAFPEGWHVAADELAGHFLFRAGAAPGAALTEVLASPPGDGLGTVRASAAGREWFRSAGLRAHPGDAAFEPAVFPMDAARLLVLRAAPTGSGSVSLKSSAFKTEREPKPVEDGGYMAHLWQTVGVDYGKVSGAEALWVFVGGHFGFGQRALDWSMDLDAAKPGELQVDGARFTYRPAGSALALSGLLLCPADAVWRLTAEGDKTRLAAWLRAPDEGREFTWSDTPKDFDLSLEGDSPAEDPTLLTRKEREVDAARLRETISQVTTDNSMGAPTLRRRVRSHHVIVLMLHAGEAPAVAVENGADQRFLRVGPQTVRYWEFLVEFEKGMRDVLDRLQAGGTP
jgi:hypothetical protein